jgi:hypothetical protein
MFMEGPKLKYHISRTTDIDSSIVKESIIRILDNKKYKIESVKSDRIVFDGVPGRSHKRLGEGQFVIMPINDGSVIKLEYYTELLVPLMFFGIALFAGIAGKVYAAPVVLGSIFFVIGFVEKLVWKAVANSLLDDILNNSGHESTEHN